MLRWDLSVVCMAITAEIFHRNLSVGKSGESHHDCGKEHLQSGHKLIITLTSALTSHSCWASLPLWPHFRSRTLSSPVFTLTRSCISNVCYDSQSNPHPCPKPLPSPLTSPSPFHPHHVDLSVRRPVPSTLYQRAQTQARSLADGTANGSGDGGGQMDIEAWGWSCWIQIAC